VTAPESGQITVHVVEDHPLYRAALLHVIEATPDLAVGVGAGSVEEFAAARPATEAVVTLDLRLPGLSNAEAVAHVVWLGFRVLVLSASGDPVDVRSALAAGTMGYLTKDADVPEIRRAIRTVYSGRRYLPPSLATHLSEPAAGPRLSKREQQVLALLAGGARDQDIADELNVSIRTVRTHLDRIREKTGRRRRSDLTRLALEKGLVTGRRSVPEAIHEECLHP
jgi:two-component system, NarL family, nitrate/nitrite response regulator NarL